MYKKLNLLMILPAVLLLAVCLLANPVSAQNTHCDGCTTGTFSGSTACLKDGNLHICPVNFPDKKFRDYVLNTLNNGNDTMSTSSANAVLQIDVPSNYISSMSGIEFFTELNKLNATHNKLYQLDLSKNTNLTILYCGNNRLTALDLSHNTKLAFLVCDSNNISSLILDSENLVDISTRFNELRHLDLSKVPNLVSFSCFSNELTQLDLSNNTKLTNLECSKNKITNLNHSNNPELVILNCYDNRLTELFLTSNSKLVSLNCSKNSITSLDLSQLRLLKTLYCSSNKLSSLLLPVNGHLEEMNCADNLLTKLDVTVVPKLMHFNCENNKLAYVDFCQNKRLYNPQVGNQNTDNITVNTLVNEQGTSVKIDLTTILSSYSYTNITITPIDNAHFDPHTNVLTLPNYGAKEIIVNATLPSNSNKIYRAPQITFSIRIQWPHIWLPATCISPETCDFCGETRGKLADHNWLPPTKSQPNVCSDCGAKSGHPLEHVYKSATCSRPATCLYCDATTGDPLPHTWTEATCTTYARCKKCNAIKDYEYAHVWKETSGCTTSRYCKLCHKKGPSLYDSHVWEGPTLFSPKRCTRCGAWGGTSYYDTYYRPVLFTVGPIFLIAALLYLIFKRKGSKSPATTFWYLFTRDKHQDEMQK